MAAIASDNLNLLAGNADGSGNYAWDYLSNGYVESTSEDGSGGWVPGTVY